MPKGRTRPQASCHPERPHYAHGLCGSCYTRRLIAQNPELARHRRCVASVSDKCRSRLPHRLQQRDKYWLKSEYGLTPETYAILRDQYRVCGICGRDFDTEKPHVDHDHETGAVRGLLCRACNTGLGFFERHKTQAEDYLAVNFSHREPDAYFELQKFRPVSILVEE